MQQNLPPPVEWLMEIPPVSRLYLLASSLLSAACAFDLVSPLNLYFNARLIAKGQVWRCATTFLYFGSPGLDFALHMYFLVRYSRMLEESREFHGKSSDFFWLLCFGMLVICLLAPFLHVTFFGSSLTFMMVYVWARRNENVMLSFLGLFPFRAPYLPWILLTFSAVVGSNAFYSMIVDGLGILAGHLYFYIMDVLPRVAKLRGWELREGGWLQAPVFVKWMFGETDMFGREVIRQVDDAREARRLAQMLANEAGGEDDVRMM